MKYVIILILLILILVFLIRNSKRENMINLNIFTEDIISRKHNFKTNINLTRRIIDCLKNRNNNFYGCINSLNIDPSRDYIPVLKSRYIDYLKSSDTKDLELHRF